MADTGRRMTDAEFRRLRAKIKDVYREAYEDIYRKNLDFVKRHEQKEAQYRQMVAEGRISRADFNAWMRGQVFMGNQWEAKRKQMQATLLNADQMAMDMINDSRLRVFADNANYIGYELEKHGRVQTSFGLYDAESVKRLLMEEPELLPPRKVGRDESYRWYNKQIHGAITQGIIQGEKLSDIAKRVGMATGEATMNAMLRNARTMHTGAECAGRIEGMHQAQKLGINVQKKWLATLDNHTRDSHRTLDKQVRDVDKPFNSELGKIMFPGDPTAHPGNVWNCRCTLTYVYPEYPDSMAQRRDNTTGEVIEDMTYREWEQWKRAEQNRRSKQQTRQVSAGTNAGTTKQASQNTPSTQKNQFGYDLTEPGKKDVFNTFKSTNGAELKVKVERASEAKPSGRSVPMKDKADFDIYTMPDGTRMHFMSKLDTKKQTLTPDKLIKAWYDIPDAYRKKIQKNIWIVDYQNPEDAYWAKKYKMPNFKSYMVGGNDITIWNATHHSESYLRQSLCHEGGHLIDVLKDGSLASESKKWKKAMADDRKHSKKESPTEYGKSHTREDFAESCALYIRQPSMMKKDFPARTKLITELLNGTFKK